MSGAKCDLEAEAAARWSAWTLEASDLDLLAKSGFITERPTLAIPPLQAERDPPTPTVTPRFARSYRETSDLWMLFHTACTPHNNALLVLGPYGSLCWRGIVERWTVTQIRQEAIRVFGVDEVESFFDRLAALGFVENWRKPAGRAGLGDEAGLPKEFCAPQVQHRMRQARLPWYCLWELSRRCDLRCRICYLPSFEDNATASKRREIARALIEARIPYVGLLGGEPLLVPDLVPLVRTLREAGIFVKIISNGCSLSPEIARELAGAELNQIEISFDGLTPAVHDASRGPGTFERARQAVAMAWQAGIPRVAAVLTVHSQNLDQLSLLPGFLDGLRIHECYLSLFKRAGHAVSHAHVAPPDESDADAIEAALAEWRQSRPDLTISLTRACTCGRTSAVIDPEGNLRVCSFAPVSRGNLHEKSFACVWERIGGDAQESGPLGLCRRSLPVLPKGAEELRQRAQGPESPSR